MPHDPFRPDVQSARTGASGSLIAAMAQQWHGDLGFGRAAKDSELAAHESSDRSDGFIDLVLDWLIARVVGAGNAVFEVVV